MITSIVLAAAACAPTQGVAILQTEEILPPVPGSGFGRVSNGVAFDGDTLVISYDTEDSLEVFERDASGWQHRQTLTSPDPTVVQFPWAFDVQGDVIAVGAAGGGASGLDDRVFVFRRSGGTWAYEDELITGEPSMAWKGFGNARMFFGVGWSQLESVKVNGDRIVVGSTHLDSGPPHDTEGTVFVFEHSQGQWSVQQRLGTAHASIENRFGAAVDFDGERIVVGDPWANEPATSGWVVGRAHVFEEIGGVWTEVQLLDPVSTNPNADGMGAAVSIDGDVLAIATNHLVSRAEIYERVGGAWVHRRQVTASGGGTYFGRDIEVEGSLVFVGCESTGQHADREGRVYVFSDDGNQWNEAAVVAANLTGPARFGASVAVSDRQLIAGAPYLDGRVFGMDYCPLIGTRYCSSNPNSTGLSATICAGGDPVRSDENVTLFAHSLPQSAFGYFLFSEAQQHVPTFGGSQGDLCVGGGAPIFRLSLYVLQSPELGNVRLDLPWSNLPPGATLDAGETWNFQYWFRDANPNVTSNTSDAVAITLQ